ncbi:MAG TPA: succinate dehydrogenase [Blastocatellia bacterium]|nr:succinate dehydrogenase [Blastocatellia bacterium]
MSIQIKRHFVLRKLHQLTGIIPLGLFMMEHFYSNWVATHGREDFNKGVEWLHGMPYLLVLEFGFIFIPLLYHSIYGLIITYEGRPNNYAYGYARNWMYTIQRITGIILFVFIAWHIYEFRISSDIPKAMADMKPSIDSFQIVSDRLKIGIEFAWYVVGIGSVVFHLANGLWLFLIDWGIAIGPKAQRALGYVCLFIGIGLFIFGLDAAAAFVRPGGLFAPFLR